MVKFAHKSTASYHSDAIPPTMKSGIHPKYFSEAKIVCACGVTYTIGSSLVHRHRLVCSVPPILYGQAEDYRQRTSRREVLQPHRPQGRNGHDGKEEGSQSRSTCKNTRRQSKRRSVATQRNTLAFAWVFSFLKHCTLQPTSFSYYLPYGIRQARKRTPTKTR